MSNEVFAHIRRAGNRAYDRRWVRVWPAVIFTLAAVGAAVFYGVQPRSENGEEWLGGLIAAIISLLVWWIHYAAAELEGSEASLTEALVVLGDLFAEDDAERDPEDLGWAEADDLLKDPQTGEEDYGDTEK